MLGRYIAIKIVVSLLLFTGCATAPRKAPRFNTPSTVPIQKAISTAKTKVQAAKEKTVIIGEECPQARAMVYALTQDLDGAMSELSTAEGARDQLQLELAVQVKQANDLADDYDKAAAQIESLKESRHRWVKWFAVESAVLSGVLLWLFRKPLFGLLRLAIPI